MFYEFAMPQNAGRTTQEKAVRRREHYRGQHKQNWMRPGSATVTFVAADGRVMRRMKEPWYMRRWKAVALLFGLVVAYRCLSPRPEAGPLAVYRGDGLYSPLVVVKAPDGTLREAHGAPISWMHNYLFVPFVFKAGLAVLFVWCAIKGINRLNDYSAPRRWVVYF